MANIFQNRFGDNILFMQILLVASCIGTILMVVVICCGKTRKRPPKKGFGFRKKTAKNVREYYEDEYGYDTVEEPIDDEYYDGGETDEQQGEGENVEQYSEEQQGKAETEEQETGESTTQLSPVSVNLPKKAKLAASANLPKKGKKYKSEAHKQLSEQVYMKTVAINNDTSPAAESEPHRYPSMEKKISRELKTSIKSKKTSRGRSVAPSKYSITGSIKQTMKLSPVRGKSKLTAKVTGKRSTKRSKKAKSAVTKFAQSIEQISYENEEPALEGEEEYQEEVVSAKKKFVRPTIPKKSPKRWTKKIARKFPTRRRPRRR